MKRTSELTETELLALSGEDFSRQVDFECAHEGIPMLPPHPGPAPVNNLPTPECKVYKVGDFKTTDADLAKQILQLLTTGPLVKTERVRGYDGPSYVKPVKEDNYGYPKLETETVYSEKQWAAMEENQKKYQEDKKAYDALLQVYNEAFEGRKAIIDELSERLREARNKRDYRDQIRQESARYLELAEGNTTIAMNFLLKARPEVAEKYPELVQELCPGYDNEPEMLPAQEA